MALPGARGLRQALAPRADARPAVADRVADRLLHGRRVRLGVGRRDGGQHMSSRTWAGTTLEDRAAARRAALIEAGTELLGTEGAAGVTVRAACRATKLSERYFYESFDGRDALLRAVHRRSPTRRARRSSQRLPRTWRRVARTKPLSAYDASASAWPTRRVGAIHRFPGRRPASWSRPAERVLLRHRPGAARHRAGPGLRRAADRADHGAARWADAIDAELTAVALIGALRNLYLAWMEGRPGMSTERLNAHAARLIIAAARVSSRAD